MSRIVSLLLTTLGIFLVGHLHSQDKPGYVEIRQKPVSQPSDTTRYELIVLDPGFETWLIGNSKPVWYYSDSFYKTKNILSVNQWNNHVRNSHYRPPFEFEIDYDPKTDYGIEFNWKLYWYFRYLESKLGIRLE